MASSVSPPVRPLRKFEAGRAHPPMTQAAAVLLDAFATFFGAPSNNLPLKRVVEDKEEVPRMDYQDFTVDIRSATSGDFEATVVTAPIRQAPRVFFPEPIEKETLSALAGFFDRPAPQTQQKPPAKLSPRRLGQALYSAVFKDKLGDLFKECRAAIPR